MPENLTCPSICSIPPVAYFCASADDRLQIRLSGEFLDFLRQTEPESAEHMTVLFKITVALLHELAHVFHHVRFGHNAESAITEGGIPEMSYAIEYFLFGILCEANFASHQNIFLAAELEEENFTWKDRATGDYVAPGSWVKSWFFKHTWDRIWAEGHQFMKKEVERWEQISIVDCPLEGLVTTLLTSKIARDKSTAVVWAKGINASIEMELQPAARQPVASSNFNP